MKTIRASEIGAYLYCKRAWWYQRQGIQADNQAELADGIELHQRHERTVIASGCLQILAYLILLAAIVLATVSLVSQVY